MTASRLMMGKTPLASLLIALAACSGAPRGVSPPTRPALDIGGATAPATASASATASPAAPPPACAEPDSLACAEWKCDKGAAEACMSAADQHEPAGALRSLERACQLDHGPGCTGAARAYDDGRGVAKDVAKAMELFVRGCDLGHAEGCNAAGYDLAEGDEDARDPARAAGLFERSCQLESYFGCAVLAELHNDGRGVAIDQKRATELYLRSCSLDQANGGSGIGSMLACEPAAERLLEGIGIAQDVARAKELYEYSCGYGGFHGCDMARHMAKTPGATTGCPHTALQSAHEPLTNRARMYATGNRVPRHPAKAVALLEAGCKDGEGSGCVQLAARYAKGDGVPRNAARARRLYRRARVVLEQQCKCHNDSGCHGLALLHLQGLGGPKNQREGKRLMDIACAGAHASQGGYGQFSFPECSEDPTPLMP